MLFYHDDEGFIINVLITRFSKGIGLTLTAEAFQKDYQVFGVARLPEQASETLRLGIRDCFNIDILFMKRKQEKKLFSKSFHTWLQKELYLN